MHTHRGKEATAPIVEIHRVMIDAANVERLLLENPTRIVQGDRVAHLVYSVRR
jgi:hypothetical protein